MAITPADIEKKTFSTALRGYDLDEVDDFLDEMVVAVRGLEEELGQARARIAELERDPNAPAAVVTAPPAVVTAPAAPAVDESAVGRALVAAQQAADRMLDEARVEADNILEGARTEADTLDRERDEKKAEVEAEMAEMTQLVAGVRTQLAVLATTVADKLDEMDAVVAGTPPADVMEEEASEEIVDLEAAAAEEALEDGNVESDGILMDVAGGEVMGEPSSESDETDLEGEAGESEMVEEAADAGESEDGGETLETDESDADRDESDQAT